MAARLISTIPRSECEVSGSCNDEEQSSAETSGTLSSRQPNINESETADTNEIEERLSNLNIDQQTIVRSFRPQLPSQLTSHPIKPPTVVEEQIEITGDQPPEWQKQLFNYIDTDDFEALASMLDTMQLRELDTDDFATILILLFEHCRISSRTSAAKLILRRFIAANANDSIPLVTEFFTWPDISDDIQAFMFSLSDITGNNLKVHFRNLIEYESSGATLLAAQRLAKLTTSLSNEDYTELYNYAFAQQNQDMQDFLRSDVIRTNVFAPKPDYIGNWRSKSNTYNVKVDDPSTIEREYTIPYPRVHIKNPDTETAVSMLMDAMGRLDIQVNKGDLGRWKDELRFRYENSTEKERKRLLGPVGEDMRVRNIVADPLYFRMLGPANTITDMKFINKEHPCYLFGGCRMFTCVHFTSVDPEAEINEPTLDWFSGSCDQCLRRIEVKCYAWRRPLINGGWVGCYCSKECTLLMMESLEDQCDQLVQENAPSLWEYKLIEVVDQKLKSIGIQDRLPGSQVSILLDNQVNRSPNLGIRSLVIK